MSPASCCSGSIEASCRRRFWPVSLQHLLDLCPRCRREFEAFRRRAGTESPKADAGLVSAALAFQVMRLKKEHRRAERDLRDLLALDQDERFGRIRRPRARFRGGHLAHLLLEKGQEQLTTDPGEALQLIELAYLVLQHSPIDADTLGLLALTSASLGNASRVGGDRRRAEKHFGQARHLVTQHGVTDAGLLARIDDLEGSLRKDQRRLGQAEELFSRAALLYAFAGDRLGLVRALLNLGATYGLQGRTGQAIEVTRVALAELSPMRETRLYLNGRYNLVLFLVEGGQLEEAREILEIDASLYIRYPEPWVQLRLTGLRGKIASARGDFATAETAFLEMRDGDRRRGSTGGRRQKAPELARLCNGLSRHPRLPGGPPCRRSRSSRRRMVRGTDRDGRSRFCPAPSCAAPHQRTCREGC
jgi:tetratricopeptide (TPR) repeat protein